MPSLSPTLSSISRTFCTTASRFWSAISQQTSRAIKKWAFRPLRSRQLLPVYTSSGPQGRVTRSGPEGRCSRSTGFGVEGVGPGVVQPRLRADDVEIDDNRLLAAAHHHRLDRLIRARVHLLM